MNIFQTLIESRIRNIGGGVGVRLRRAFYKRKFNSCGKNLRVDVGVIMEGLSFITIGDNVWIDKNCILMAGKVNLSVEKEKRFDNSEFFYKEGELNIGSNVHFAPGTIIQAHGGVQIGDYFTASAGCKIYSLSNDPALCKMGTYSSDSIAYVKSQIVIKENVWLGLNTIVLGGTIHKNSFITPNSIVVKSLEENSYAGGNPAIRIKERFK